MKLLLVTNDFPPRVGGIQSYLLKIYEGIAAMGVDVRVLAPAFPGDAAFDADVRMEVERWPGPVAWPRGGLRRRIVQLSAQADVVTFGAVLPMNLLASKVDRPVLVHTHGFEVAWARVPGMRSALQRIADAATVLTVVSDFTRRAIERATGDRARIEMLKTGVDVERFNPNVDASPLRARLGIEARPVISCVSRLVPRKGQDQLIKALPAIRARVPDATLLITGRGPDRARLERLARDANVADAVVFAGEVPEDELPAAYAAGDVFAMPCRNRFAGLEVEGLGLVYLEAQACARPALVGTSGGAPEAVIPGETGLIVPPADPTAIASAVAGLLADPEACRSMGEAGRRFVEREHRWGDVVRRFHGIVTEL